MRTKSLLPIALLASLTACGEPPSAGCVTTSLSALGNAGVYGNAKAENITPMQCQQIQWVAERSGCGVEVYAYMRDHPEDAMAAFAPSAQAKAEDIKGLVGPAEAVMQACGF